MDKSWKNFSLTKNKFYRIINVLLFQICVYAKEHKHYAQQYVARMTNTCVCQVQRYTARNISFLYVEC